MEAAAFSNDFLTPLPSGGLQAPSPNGKGVVYRRVITRQEGHQKFQEEWWMGAWNDHCGRLITRRVVPVSRCHSEDAARRQAVEVAKRLIDERDAALIEKDAATPEELEERAESVNFPREVVAREIRRLLRIVSVDIPELPELNVQPGFKLFAMRTGISTRELHRVLTERDRLTVSVAAVDKVCVEFDLILNDFVSSSLDWADMRGSWRGRPGQRDPWPYGRIYRIAPES